MKIEIRTPYVLAFILSLSYLVFILYASDADLYSPLVLLAAICGALAFVLLLLTTVPAEKMGIKFTRHSFLFFYLPLLGLIFLALDVLLHLEVGYYAYSYGRDSYFTDDGLASMVLIITLAFLLGNFLDKETALISLAPISNGITHSILRYTRVRAKLLHTASHVFESPMYELQISARNEWLHLQFEKAITNLGLVVIDSQTTQIDKPTSKYPFNQLLFEGVIKAAPLQHSSNRSIWRRLFGFLSHENPSTSSPPGLENIELTLAYWGYYTFPEDPTSHEVNLSQAASVVIQYIYGIKCEDEAAFRAGAGLHAKLHKLIDVKLQETPMLVHETIVSEHYEPVSLLNMNEDGYLTQIEERFPR